MNEKKMPSINEVNILFLLIGLALLVLGAIVQQRELYTGVLITEYILILIPNIIFLKLKGYSLKKVLRLNSITAKQIIYIFFIMLFAYPVAVFLNFIVMILVNSISQTIPTGVPIPTNLSEYTIGLFVIALTPGICEEVMFRGTLMSAYNKLGEKKAVIISAILFGFFHFNLLNLVGPIFLGIVLGIVLVKTNSLYGPIFGHTLNNAIALTFGFFLSQFTENLQEIITDAPIIPEGIQLIITIIFLAGWALFSLVILFLLIKHLPAAQKPISIEEEDENNYKMIEVENDLYYANKPIIKERILWSPVIIILGIFIYVNYMVLGF